MQPRGKQPEDSGYGQLKIPGSVLPKEVHAPASAFQ